MDEIVEESLLKNWHNLSDGIMDEIAKITSVNEPTSMYGISASSRILGLDVNILYPYENQIRNPGLVDGYVDMLTGRYPIVGQMGHNRQVTVS